MPYRVVEDLEAALCEYTGARYAVTTNSCTMALLLAVAWHCEPHQPVQIPALTYLSVPMSIWHAGAVPVFRQEDWIGAYQLKPLPVWDSARRFTSGMYVPGQMQCVSFHASKILGHSQGGAILHDDQEADAWLRRARFDGRAQGVAPKDDAIPMIGWHCYMSADVAAALLLKLHHLPRHNADLPNDDYPPLDAMEIFR